MKTPQAFRADAGRPFGAFALLGRRVLWLPKCAILKLNIMLRQMLDLACHHNVGTLPCDKQAVAIPRLCSAMNQPALGADAVQRNAGAITESRCTKQLSAPGDISPDERLLNTVALERRNGLYGL